MSQIIKPQTYTATVISVTNVAGKFYVAKLQLVDPKDMPYTAGQYVIFKIGPPKGNHTLSIASAPSADGSIELLQSVAPMGEGSRWLLGLKPGDPVQFLGPLGRFTLQAGPLGLSEASPRPKVFVATGCGIAPLRAMIVDELSDSREQRTESREQRTENRQQMIESKQQIADNRDKMTLYWGLRNETDVFWKDEFERLAVEHPYFRFVLTLSKPTDAWVGAKGRVTEHVIGETPDVKNAEFYLCGTRAMIVDMRELLTKNGVPAEQIFTETFF